MAVGATSDFEQLRPETIAPCGMDCGVCTRHLRAQDACDGCRSSRLSKPKYCSVCRIRNCDEFALRGSTFCFECATFPCARLRRLDARYRGRYGMSMLENLARIRDGGLEAFVASEKTRWRCPECGALLCVHKPECLECGHARG